MRNISVTDLVPVKVLYDIAKRIRAQAVTVARSKGLPPRVHDGKEEGISGRSIGILPAKITSSQIEIGLTLNGVGLAYEYGSGVHKTKKSFGAPGRYHMPKSAGAVMVFPGTNKWRGETIIAESVMHPGVAPRPFLEPAKRATRSQNLEEIRRTNLENMKLIIKGMARKS